MSNVSIKVCDIYSDHSGAAGLCEYRGFTFSMSWTGGEVKATLIGGPSTGAICRSRYSAAELCRAAFQREIDSRTTPDFRAKTADFYAH